MSSHTIRLPVPDDTADERVDLWVNGIHYPPERGFSIHVYLNQEDAHALTPTENNPHYVGRGVVMARRHFPEAVAQGLLPWADPSVNREPDPPLSFRLDVTKQLQELAGRASWLTVTLVTVDPSGEKAPEAALEFEGVELRTSPR